MHQQAIKRVIYCFYGMVLLNYEANTVNLRIILVTALCLEAKLLLKFIYSLQFLILLIQSSMGCISGKHCKTKVFLISRLNVEKSIIFTK